MKRVLFVTSFAEPDPVGGNRVVFSQAENLKRLGVDVEILTWPKNCTWRGPVPSASSPRLAGQPYLQLEREGIRFHVVDLPNIWSERVLTEPEWHDAVEWATRALRELRPDMVHQQFWQSLWWTMEASTSLGIPTLYSAHDYGIACLRTVLVTGRDTLCDAKLGLAKCSYCIVIGRNWIGKANEAVAQLPGARRALGMAYGRAGTGPLAKRLGLRLPVQDRVGLTLERCRRIFPQLSNVIAASPFAGEFFQQLGAKDGGLRVLPWFSDLVGTRVDEAGAADALRLGFVGRLSPDKGLHVLLEALESVRGTRPIHLRIAGSFVGDYGESLRAKYGNRAGESTVEWLGWVAHADIAEFYRDVDVSVVPSLWYDNTPAALIEALALGRAVVCTDVPSMTHMVKTGVNGSVFPMGDAKALANRIQVLVDEPALLRRYIQGTGGVLSASQYAEALAAVYAAVPS